MAFAPNRSSKGKQVLAHKLNLIAVMVLSCHAVAAPGLAATFQDPLERPAQVIGAMAPSQRLTAIARAGERLVAAGPRGVILLSDDEGKSWRQAPSPVSSDLVALHFRTALRGWAVGHDGVILATVDGGRQWTRQLDGTKAAQLIGRYYQGRADPALAAEAKAFQQDGADKPFLDILFTSDSEGFAVGAFNLAMRTSDGGASWEPLIDRTANPKGLHLYALAVAGGELYLGGEQGLLRRWNRAAGKFEEVVSPSQGSFFGLLGKGDTLFAFGLQGKAFRSRDGAQSWSTLRGTGPASITAATALRDGRVVFASQGGKLLASADEGDTFTELAPPKHPMPYAGVAPSGQHALAVVGSYGVASVASDARPMNKERE